jgi:Trk K+ transport system NAD-binding subunit
MNDIPILVLGAGELGMPVLRNLVKRMEFARIEG